MNGQRYILAFDGRDLAAVTQEDADFPNLWGCYELLPDVAAAPELGHVMDYLAFCVRVAPLREQDRFDEISTDEEMTFVDLIESEAWLLRDASGKAHPILVPLFGTDGQITWRWS